MQDTARIARPREAEMEYPQIQLDDIDETEYVTEFTDDDDRTIVLVFENRLDASMFEDDDDVVLLMPKECV